MSIAFARLILTVLFAIPTAHALSEMIVVVGCGYPMSYSVVRADVSSLPKRNNAAYSASPTDEHTVGMMQLIVSIMPLTDPSLFRPK
jgi:hypothetical protein